LLAQQPAHQLLAHLEALPAQRLRNVPLTAADPTQRSLGITADRVFNQPFERSHKTWLARRLSLAPGPATPDATTDFIASGFSFGNPTIDCAPGQPDCRGNRCHPAAAERYRLIGGKQPTPPLIQERRHPRKPSANAVDVNHNHKISLCTTPP
jgi:hypothetical protein